MLIILMKSDGQNFPFISIDFRFFQLRMFQEAQLISFLSLWFMNLLQLILKPQA